MRFGRVVTLGCLVWSVACADESPPPAAIYVDPATIPPVIDCAGTPNRLVCEGHWSAQCGASGPARDAVNCSLDDLTCVVDVGCRVCVPNAAGCNANNEVYRCNADGSGFSVTQTCGAATVCNAAANGCIDMCADAESSSSYVGCDYWAVTTSNSQLDWDVDPITGELLPRVFDFEVVVANPQSVAAEVSITRGSATTIAVTVPPSEVMRVVLPWVEELVGRADPHTSHVRDGAYHIESSVPVTVYQFNPMEFRRRVTGTNVFSFTNDASLLLPTHVLTGNYMVMSRASLGLNVTLDSDSSVREGFIPGFVAIVGVEDRDINVEITSSAFTAASPDGTVPALVPGQTVNLLVAAGDVVQLTTTRQQTCIEDAKEDVLAPDGMRIGIRRHCTPDPEYDLTGTTIRASGKVSVIAGHDCAFVPFNMSACDHLEETMFPEEAWGTRVPVAISASITGQRELPDIVRVVSSHDANRVTFQPPVHDEVILNRGEHMEFVADTDFIVTGTQALMVAQFLVGQSYNELNATTGDPAMALGIPDAQWRNSYAFLTPNSYEQDFVNVIAPTGAPVTLDDVAVMDWTVIEGTNLSSARVSVLPGQHRMTSSSPFGITAYGYAPFTSYMYPGGLDLRVINGPE